jgi:hypothetical protein
LAALTTLGLDSEAAATGAAVAAAEAGLGVLGFWAAGVAAEAEVVEEEAATGAEDVEDCLAILIDGFMSLLVWCFILLVVRFV